MATDQSHAPAAKAAEIPGHTSRLSRLLALLILGLLAFLLVEVLFEAWVQTLLGSRSLSADHKNVEIALPDWPKQLKNGIYLTLLGLTAIKILVEQRWRSFTTKADIALVVLGGVLVVAGLFGDSSPALIGQALFVYFRGAVVFYAWRALNPSWRQVKPVLWIVGTVVTINALIAIVQTAGGYPTYEALRWVDFTWARINRAHALLDHPNHLGHVIGIALLGLLAWFVTKPKVGRWWWTLFVILAFGLSATQSRESTIAVVCAGLLIWALRRGAVRTIATGLVVVMLFAGLQLAFSPNNRAQLALRLAGVFAALSIPSGLEDEDFCVKGNAGCEEENGIPQREIRVLYAQQAGKLWLASPVVGYGVGQFGGIVAFQHDPHWNTNPRFAAVLPGRKGHPGGFDTYGFNAKQVDSFWLHLLVETGSLGFLTYLTWLFLIILPVLRVRPRKAGAARGPTTADGVHPAVYWGPAVLLFAVLVAFLSPSLEDPLFPALVFGVLGLSWVVLQRGETSGVRPTTGLAGPAVPVAVTAAPEEPSQSPERPATKADQSAPASNHPAPASQRAKAPAGAQAGSLSIDRDS